jgi:hypothetical protein
MSFEVISYKQDYHHDHLYQHSPCLTLIVKAEVVAVEALPKGVLEYFWADLLWEEVTQILIILMEFSRGKGCGGFYPFLPKFFAKYVWGTKFKPFLINSLIILGDSQHFSCCFWHKHKQWTRYKDKCNHLNILFVLRINRNYVQLFCYFVGIQILIYIQNLHKYGYEYSRFKMWFK